jgi:hypothetical protein
VRVSGAGFGPFEAVDVYFDATDQLVVVASRTGTFSGITVQVPTSAVLSPGTVPGIDEDWSFTTGGQIYYSSALCL